MYNKIQVNTISRYFGVSESILGFLAAILRKFYSSKESCKCPTSANYSLSGYSFGILIKDNLLRCLFNKPL
jgi:hypothetical protein